MNEFYPWQDALWQRWIELRARLPHALLLKGPAGVGKFDFAMNMAQSMLCENPQVAGMACQTCQSCHLFLLDTHPDFRLLQPNVISAQDEEKESNKKPAKKISVEQIRELTNFFNLSAHQGGFRVVLIHPAETMNVNAANALLKSLEEPTANMLIILVSHKPQQLLPTILSRCLVLVAPLPSLEESTAWLQKQEIANPVTQLAQTGFAPLQVIRQKKDTDIAGEYERFLQAIKQPDRLDIYTLAEQLQRTEPSLVIHWLQQWCYDLTSSKLAGKVRYNLKQIDLINKLSARIDPFKLMQFQKELTVARREALHPLNPKLLFESILISYKQMMLAPVAND